MKKIVLSMVAVLTAMSMLPAPPARAQQDGAPTAAQMQALRDRIRADKKGLVAKNMALTEAEAAKFWPIYDDYQRDSAAVQRRRSRAILDYVGAGDSLTDGSAKQIVDELLAVEQAEAKLHRDYFRKLSRALPARKAARYLQIESKIDALYRYDLALTIPLVE